MKISLISGYYDKTQLADIAEKLDELKQSLLELDVELEVKLNPNIHDCEIRLDNGWIIKIGRGLDFYQKPGGARLGRTISACGSAWKPRWVFSVREAGCQRRSVVSASLRVTSLGRTFPPP